MDKLMRLPLLLLLILAFAGCDKKTGPLVTNSEAPTTTAPSASPSVPSPQSPAQTEHLQLVLLPTTPTAKTALYARVSGAREAVSFHWQKNGQPIEGEETSALDIAYLAKGDSIEVEAVAGDLRAQTSVVILNSPPSITAVHFNYGSVITVEPKGEDPDEDAVAYRYQWMVNDDELLFETTNVLPGDLFVKGDRVAVAITPYDNETDGETVRIKDVLIENKPPQITSAPPSEFAEKDFVYTIVAEDPEGEALTYSLETAPEGMQINHQTGEVHWSIGAEVTGPQPVKIKVEDASGRWSKQEFSLNIGNIAQ